MTGAAAPESTDKDVRSHPWCTDHSLARMGKLVLADLTDQRSAIDKMWSGN